MIKVKQILINLLNNANKFTEAGTLSLDVDKSIEKDRTWFILTVTDTGIGIAEDKIKSIFTPFEQADSSLTRIREGTGLGLTITQRFCYLLKGSIDVKSELGKGTTVAVKIPNATQPKTFPPNKPCFS